MHQEVPDHDTVLIRIRNIHWLQTIPWKLTLAN